MVVLHLNPVDLFFLGNLLKPVKTRRSPWEYLGSPKYKHASLPRHDTNSQDNRCCFFMGRRAGPVRIRPLDALKWTPMGQLSATIVNPRVTKWLKYAGSEICWRTTTPLARCIKSICPKWCAFRLPNPPEILFQRRVFPRKKLDIPGDPGKTKHVKCINPPPQDKRSWGGRYPDPWILYFSDTTSSKNVFRGVLGSQLLQDDKCFFP